MNAPEGDELDAWPVYADWLQTQADPHERALGEAIISGTAAWPTEHREAWLGPLTDLRGCNPGDWVGGFPRTLTLTVDGPTPEAIVAQALGHRASRRVTELVIQSSYDVDASIASVVALLVATRRPRGLSRLEIRNEPNFGGPYRTYPVAIGDVSGLWRTYHLESLLLEGDALQLGEIRAPALRQLRVDLAGREPLERIAAADLTQLETLDLQLGVESYPAVAGWLDVVDLLGPVFDPARLVGLRKLTLRTRHAMVPQIIAMVPRAASLPRLAALDLFTGPSTLELLAPHRAGLAHLVVRVGGKPFS